jgi:hypothetical protein
LYKQKRERHLVPIDDVRSSYTYWRWGGHLV